MTSSRHRFTTYGNAKRWFNLRPPTSFKSAPTTAAQAELAKLRGDALALTKPFLKRLVASLDESLNARPGSWEAIETEGFPIVNGETWTLHNDGVFQALWFRRVKAEKTLEVIEPGSAVGAVQFFLTNEEHTV